MYGIAVKAPAQGRMHVWKETHCCHRDPRVMATHAALLPTEEEHEAGGSPFLCIFQPRSWDGNTKKTKLLPRWSGTWGGGGIRNVKSLVISELSC